LHHSKRYQAKSAILAFAGNIEFSQIKDAAAKNFADWKAFDEDRTEIIPPPGRIHHEQHESEQTHIGIAYPSIEETDPEYYAMRLGIEVLSGGMSGRLFTEVREKRALVYNVWAGYSSLKGYGSILGYAGTSNDRAQEHLDTIIVELC